MVFVDVRRLCTNTEGKAVSGMTEERIRLKQALKGKKGTSLQGAHLRKEGGFCRGGQRGPIWEIETRPKSLKIFRVSEKTDHGPEKRSTPGFQRRYMVS